MARIVRTPWQLFDWHKCCTDERNANNERVQSLILFRQTRSSLLGLLVIAYDGVTASFSLVFSPQRWRRRYMEVPP